MLLRSSGAVSLARNVIAFSPSTSETPQSAAKPTSARHRAIERQNAGSTGCGAPDLAPQPRECIAQWRDEMQPAQLIKRGLVMSQQFDRRLEHAGLRRLQLLEQELHAFLLRRHAGQL